MLSKILNMYSKQSVLWIVLVVVLGSCRKKEEVAPIVDKTIMVYMSANNNLASEAFDNINQMEAGFGDYGGKLIVYANIFGQAPTIYEIVHDDSPKIVSRVLKTYSAHNSSDASVMKQVFADMENLAKAKHYAAILWSHATNWYPGSEKKMSKVRSFSEDGGKTMDILDLKEALPKNLDFLIFDACSMGSVEVLYELKDIVPLILASPTEVISVGMPYDQIVRFLFLPDSQEALKKAAQLYFDFYNSQDGDLRSASFSLINLREMDNLAKVMGEIIVRNSTVQVKRDGIQRLDLDPQAINTVPAYDLLDFCQKNYPNSDYQRLKEQVDKMVLYKVNTPYFLGTRLDTFSGLSCYIPTKGEDLFHKYYQFLGWFQASSYSSLFP